MPNFNDIINHNVRIRDTARRGFNITQNKLIALFIFLLTHSSSLKKLALIGIYLLNALQMIVLGRPKTILEKVFLITGTALTNSYSVTKNGGTLSTIRTQRQQVNNFSPNEALLSLHAFLLTALTICICAMPRSQEARNYPSDVTSGLCFILMCLSHLLTAGVLRQEANRIQRENQHLNNNHSDTTSSSTEQDRSTTSAAGMSYPLLRLGSRLADHSTMMNNAGWNNGDDDNSDGSDSSDRPYVDEDNLSSDTTRSSSNSESEIASSYRNVLMHLNSSIESARACVNKILFAKESSPQKYVINALEQVSQKQKTVRDELRIIRDNFRETEAQTYKASMLQN